MQSVALTGSPFPVGMRLCRGPWCGGGGLATAFNAKTPRLLAIRPVGRMAAGGGHSGECCIIFATWRLGAERGASRGLTGNVVTWAGNGWLCATLLFSDCARPSPTGDAARFQADNASDFLDSCQH